ncbi:metalloregulator ArsR/SmtB family transcription factor [Kiritimatiellaeota bacterium B1221]|nr:metalloregulator ArsR/SmtB family transcription factor [Kiritimatiellaeota bacterium B1221]
MENLLAVYKCLCDETRLRMLNLLQVSPLCVCHIQHILNVSQVNVSRHLAYLKKHGLVETTRFQNWTIYTLPESPSPELSKNLACLQDLVSTEPVFRQDRKELAKLSNAGDLNQILSEGGCCIPENPNLKESTK